MIWAWRLLFSAIVATGFALIGFCVVASVVTLSETTIDAACVVIVATLFALAGLAHVLDANEYGADISES